MAARIEEASVNIGAAISSVLSNLPNIVSLKEHQRRALKAFVGGNIVFALLPTGFGSFIDVLVQELVVLLKDFIWRRLERHGIRDALRIREEVGAVELRSPRQEEVSETLQLIGDQVDGNVELQRILNDPLFTPSKEAFMKVVLAIFSDGKINWGRVVMVFCFTCFLVMKAHEKKICDLIRDIIKWTIDYFRDKVINWIREQGGWEGILSQVGTPTWQTVMVFLAGVLTTLFVIKMK